MTLSNNTRVITRNVAPVVSLAELKEHLNLFLDDTYDTQLDLMLVAGQEIAETYCGEFLSATTLQATWPRFTNPFTLKNFYVSSVTSVNYTNDAGVVQTVPSTSYILDTTVDRPTVNLRTGQTYPTDISLDLYAPVSITYVAEVPAVLFDEQIRTAVLLICSSLFSYRESFLASGAVPQDLPISSERLLDPIRRVNL